MAIPIQCDRCGKRYRVKEALAGRRVRCKECGQRMTVPLPFEETDYDLEERSESGSPIRRYRERTRDFQPAMGDSENIEAISEHIQTHIGDIDFVYHEIISDLVHIDVHHVAPSDDKPYHTLVTTGMSDLPMTVPEGAEAFRFAELLLSLPPSWPISQEAFKDENNYWPVRLLKVLARFPHEYETWLGYGHSLPNGDPPKPFAANTQLCGCVLLLPSLVPEEFLRLKVAEDKLIHFFSIVPVYLEEMNFKLRHGIEALEERFEIEDISELLDLERKNVCKSRR